VSIESGVAKIAMAPMKAGTAAMLNTASRSQPNESSCPPTIDPTTEPTRPIALAQLTPVARLADVRNPSASGKKRQFKGGLHRSRDPVGVDANACNSTSHRPDADIASVRKGAKTVHSSSVSKLRPKADPRPNEQPRITLVRVGGIPRHRCVQVAELVQKCRYCIQHGLRLLTMRRVSTML
jgi:hypothetical protein